MELLKKTDKCPLCRETVNHDEIIIMSDNKDDRSEFIKCMEFEIKSSIFLTNIKIKNANLDVLNVNELDTKYIINTIQNSNKNNIIIIFSPYHTQSKSEKKCCNNIISHLNVIYDDNHKKNILSKR